MYRSNFGVRLVARALLGHLALIATTLTSGCGATAPPAAPAQRATGAVVEPGPAAESWRRLMAGNARYAAAALEHPDQSAERRTEVAHGQHPFAIILSCSDSRVPPEIVFDTGLGDLFVIRVAGNTADDTAIGTIEYGAEHLGAPLVVVLGHERCGAVDAAVKAIGASKPPPGHLAAVIDPILPAATAAEQTKDGGDVLDRAVRDNVLRVTEQLRHSHPVLAEMVQDHKLTIVGCVYHLDTGRVTVVDPQSPTHH